MFFSFKTNMAAFSGGERFPHLEVSSIEELRNNAKSTNTKRSTIFWFGVCKSWAKERGFSEAIETYEAFDLDKILEKFYGEVRNKDGGEYEPDSLQTSKCFVQTKCFVLFCFVLFCFVLFCFA